METLSRNIAAYRKRLNMTQEALAQRLHVSAQAVSKWENGQSMPDISLLGDLAAALSSDINSLMGYAHTKAPLTYYEDQYSDDDFYWGLVPSTLCYEVLRLCPPTRPLRLLDVGCGEGKDAVFFARNGYQVDAFDITREGVDKARRLADRCGVPVRAFQANVLDYRLEHTYDIVFSSGVLHYIPEVLRTEILADYRVHTRTNGLHALNVFVQKPFLPPPPEREENATVWRSGELATHYADWLLHEMSEVIFDCNSSGIPHKHCMDRLTAQRIVE